MVTSLSDASRAFSSSQVPLLHSHNMHSRKYDLLLSRGTLNGTPNVNRMRHGFYYIVTKK